MLNVDACGVHLKVVVRRCVAEVLRLDFAAIDGIPETATRNFLRGLAVPAMFVYSLVFEFPEMMAGGDARAQRVVVVRELPQPKAGERVRARGLISPAGSEEDKWRLKKHSSCSVRGSSTGRDTRQRRSHA